MKMHAADRQGRPLCGTFGFGLPTTSYWPRVTCQHCLDRRDARWALGILGAAVAAVVIFMVVTIEVPW